MATETPTGSVPLFDTTLLHRHTRGDPKLQVEVLALFVAEVERLMNQIEDAPNPELRGERLRALIGLCRNTGASRLAHEARTLETQIAAEEPDMESLRVAVKDTLAHVRRAAG
jgi:HPt (histidine-containing phosphotransfer) domain-containing protein